MISIVINSLHGQIPKSVARMKVMDALNRCYGRETISFATSGLKPGGKLQSEFISSRFTTNWNELLSV